MANIYKGTLGLIGNTPLVEVTNIEKELGLEATVLVKLALTAEPSGPYVVHWMLLCGSESQRLVNLNVYVGS